MPSLLGTAEIRNSERELQQFQMRVGVAGVAVLIAFCLLAARFFYLQIFQHDVYRAKAEDNRISIVPVLPNRGLLLDRNGVIVARNYQGYTLEIFPRKVASLERTIDHADRELLQIRLFERRSRHKRVRTMRRRLVDGVMRD